MPLSITFIQLSHIQLPTKRLKSHPVKHIQQIADSIQAFGFNDPIAVDEAGEIVEGVGRYLAAQRLGLETLPVIRLSHLSEAQKKAYRIAHNKIASNTGFDLAALRSEFEALCQLDESLLSLTGFERIELDDLLKLRELPELAPELTESLSESKTVNCPHCGGLVHV
jgi:ParB-like chromosome segregation protein Spo0J